MSSLANGNSFCLKSVFSLRSCLYRPEIRDSSFVSFFSFLRRRTRFTEIYQLAVSNLSFSSKFKSVNYFYHWYSFDEKLKLSRSNRLVSNSIKRKSNCMIEESDIQEHVRFEESILGTRNGLRLINSIHRRKIGRQWWMNLGLGEEGAYYDLSLENRME